MLITHTEALEGSDPNCGSGLCLYFHYQCYENLRVCFK